MTDKPKLPREGWDDVDARNAEARRVQPTAGDPTAAPIRALYGGPPPEMPVAPVYGGPPPGARPAARAGAFIVVAVVVVGALAAWLLLGGAP